MESPHDSDRPPLDVPALFARAQAGDQVAWKQLFEESYPKLRRVIRRRFDARMRSVFDSTDFVHDVWLSLARRPERFDFANLDALIGFLRQSAERKLTDEQRRMNSQKRDVARERRIDARPAGEPGGFELASPDPTPSTFAIADEAREALAAAADSEEGRLVVKLRAEGYSTEEIAARTGWHPRKVQRLLHHLQRCWLDEERRRGA